MTNHTGYRLLALLFTGALALLPEPRPDTVAGAASKGPTITYVDAPTVEAREVVDWAVARFAQAGLQLPDLKISFPGHCRGKKALYHVGKRSIDFCRIDRRVALHELAHAWDDTSGAVDRERFMELRGVSVWFGGTRTPSAEQGSEHLAIIVAWGMMGERERRAHGLPRNSDAELTAAFEMLTGRSPY